MREVAIKKVIAGKLKVRQRGASEVAKVGRTPAIKGQRRRGPVRRARAREDGQDLRHARRVREPAAPAVPGPGHGPEHRRDPPCSTGRCTTRFPAPDRTKDNKTIWQTNYNRAHYQQLYFGNAPDDNSLKNYYERQSSGRYSVDGTVTNWVKVPYNEARYGRTNGFPCDNVVCGNSQELIQDALDRWVADQKAAGRTDVADQEPGQVVTTSWDRNDYDHDGNFNEPDGYIDHFQIVHAGGDQADADPHQGEDAIWSHRGKAYTETDGVAGPVDNKDGGTQIGDTGIWVADYTMQPENGGVSVFAHEYAHDLGLPDEYDTAAFTGPQENAVNWWSIMAQSRQSGPGETASARRASDFGAWDKLQLGWLDYEVVPAGQTRTLDLGPHEYNTAKAQGVVVPLGKKTVVTDFGRAPFAGTKQWWSGQGDDYEASLEREVTLPAGAATLTFQARWNIEDCGPDACDYAFVEVDDGSGYQAIPGSITNPDEGNAIDGDQPDWTPATFDLSAYAGKTIKLRLRYKTDGAARGTDPNKTSGIYADEFKLDAGGQTVFTDGAENGANGWTLDGFQAVGASLSQQFDHYYIASNRQYVSYDQYLQTGPYNAFDATRPNWFEHFPYQNGLIVSYWDTSFADNNESLHPGQGEILPIDSHPAPLFRLDGLKWRPRIQTYDAPFSLERADSFSLHMPNGQPSLIRGQDAVPVFDDRNSYWDAQHAERRREGAGRRRAHRSAEAGRHVDADQDQLDEAAGELAEARVQPAGADPIVRAGQRADRLLAEQRRQRDEHLRGGERVARRGVWPVRRQAELGGEVAERDPRRCLAVALQEPQPPEHPRVDGRPAQSRAARAQQAAEERALDPRRVGYEHAARHRLQQRVRGLVGRGGAGQVELAQAVDADRLGRDGARRPHEPLARAGQDHAPAVDRHGAPGDDRVTPRVEPGRLEVDHAERALAPRRAPPGHRRGTVGGRGGAARHRTPNRRSLAIRRWTAATARNVSFSDRRVSRLSSAGSRKSSGSIPALSCSTWCASRRPAISSCASSSSEASPASSVPSSAAARSRAGVDECVTPAAMPAQRARSAIGTMPPRLRSSRPRCSPESSTTSPRRKPVGGRCASANWSSSVSSAGLRRASRNASGTGRPSRMPHTGRPSTTSETRIRAFSCVGSSIQLLTAADPRLVRAGEQGLGGDRALRVGLEPAVGEAVHDPPGQPHQRLLELGVVAARVPDQRAVDVRGRDRLAAGDAAERDPGERHGRVDDREVEQPSRCGVDDHGRDRRDVDGRHAGVVQRDDRRAQLGTGLRHLRRRGRARDRRAQVERAARGDGDEVGVLDHADHPARRRDHREVADPAVEHVEDHLAADAVGGDGVGGRAHDLRDRAVEVGPGGHDAGAQVAVGHDPQRVAGVDDHACRAQVRHHARGLADRGVGRAENERPADQLGHGPLRRVDGRLLAIVVAERLQQRPRHVAQPGGARQQRADDRGRDPVAQRVLGRDRGEAGREARQHRAVAEQLARSEQVEHPPVVHDLDGTRAHGPDVLDGPDPLLEDLRPGRVELDLRGVRHALQITGLERVERRVRREEVGDVLQTGARYITP